MLRLYIAFVRFDERCDERLEKIEGIVEHIITSVEEQDPISWKNMLLDPDSDLLQESLDKQASRDAAVWPP